MKSFGLNSLLCAFLSLFMISSAGCRKEGPLKGTVKDIDGNVYHTVRIGDQVWMVENLKVSRLNDGTEIPFILENEEWEGLTTPGYCYPINNGVVYQETYGCLYNWYSVNSGKLCPKGWRIPSDADWLILFHHLGGDTTVGAKLKEAGMDHWKMPNTGATNSSGWTGLPAGYRNSTGYWELYFWCGFWWSADGSGINNSWSSNWALYHDKTSFLQFPVSQNYGLSVRCIKD